MRQILQVTLPVSVGPENRRADKVHPTVLHCVPGFKSIYHICIQFSGACITSVSQPFLLVALRGLSPQSLAALSQTP